MQEVTIKEVILPKSSKSPVVLVTADGARISAFPEKELAGLKDVKPGAVLMVDLEVKGKYTNITAFETVKPGTGEPTPPDAGYRDNPETRASIETQTAVKATLKFAGDLLVAAGGDNVAGVTVPPELQAATDKAIAWCNAHIPDVPQKPPAPRQPAAIGRADLDAKAELLAYVKGRFGYQSDATAINYITKHYGISKERIDAEPDKVLKEIQNK